MTQTRLSSPPVPTVWPSIGFVDVDVDAGAAFLEALGFVVTARYAGEDGVLAHAEARWPDGGGVMFAQRGKSGDWWTLGPAGVYVVAAGATTVETALAGVQDLPGVEVLQPVSSTDHGSHEFSVRDADGNLRSVGTYRGA